MAGLGDYSEIIGGGMRYGNAANLQASRDIGDGLDTIIGGVRQFEHDRKRNAILGQIESEQDEAVLESLRKQLEYHDKKGETRGLRTPMTTKDYNELELERQKLYSAQQEAKAKAEAEALEREQGVFDKLGPADLLMMDALKEYEANGGFNHETREQLINAMAQDEGIKNDEKKLQLLGELSRKDADALRTKVESIAKSAGTEFNQIFQKTMSGSMADLPKLFAAVPKVVAQGWAGKDTDTAIRIKNAIDNAFNETLDAALAERTYRRYSPEQMEAGKKRSRNRDYKPQITPKEMEDFRKWQKINSQTEDF